MVSRVSPMRISYRKSIIKKDVHVLEVSNNKSKGKYTVKVNISNQEVVDCSCPHRTYRKQYCKHMKYATESISKGPNILVGNFTDDKDALLSLKDNRLVTKLVHKYKDRIVVDSEIRTYLSRCISVWSKHQTQIYIEDIKYRFDDSYTASRVLAHRLGMEGKSV